MKKTLSILLITMIAALFAACPAGTETNTASNENTEEKPKTVEAAILEVDDNFVAAAQKKDGKFFDANLADTFVGVNQNGVWDRATVVKAVSEDPCERKPSPRADRKVTEISDGIALMTGKTSGERTCDGETIKSAQNFALLWVKDGETWKVAWYQGILTMEEKVGPADGAKKEEPAADAAKEEKPAAEEKKDEAPMVPKIQNDEEMAKALLETENKLWEAWSKNDTKPFEEMLAANFIIYSADGLGDRASEIKAIGENDCKLNSFSLADGKATKINDNLYVFTYKGTQDGTCGGKALDKVVYTTTIFTKDGDTWKPLFHMNTPEQKM